MLLGHGRQSESGRGITGGVSTNSVEVMLKDFPFLIVKGKMQPRHQWAKCCGCKDAAPDTMGQSLAFTAVFAKHYYLNSSLAAGILLLTKSEMT